MIRTARERPAPEAEEHRRTSCREAKEDSVGIVDKAKNAGQDAKGKAKEAAGKSTDNDRLETEGKADQTGADVKNAGEKVKDAFKH